MPDLSRILTMLAATMLITGSAFAESAPPAPTPAHRPEETTPAPKPYATFVTENSPLEGRWFIEVAPGYSAVHAKHRVTRDGTVMIEDRKNDNFVGADILFGHAFGVSDFGHHEVNFGTGLFVSQQTIHVSVPGNWYKTDELVTYIPLTVGYRYHFAVGKNTSIHAGVFGGAALIGYAIDSEDYGHSDNDGDFDGTWQVGAGVGIRRWFNRRFGLDVSYDYRAIGNTKHRLDLFGHTYHGRYRDMDAHSVRVGFLFAF